MQVIADEIAEYGILVNDAPLPINVVAFTLPFTSNASLPVNKATDVLIPTLFP